MKSLIVMLLVIGTFMIFIGCQEEMAVTPEVNENAQAPLSLEKRVDIPFTGTSTPTGVVIDPGTVKVLPNGKTLVKGQIAEWYDDATDLRVTGQSIWVVNKLIEEDLTAKVWGSAEIIVDNAEYVGKWDISWHGYASATGVIAYAVGVGKEGDVKGMVGKWTYTMIFANGRFYTTEGYVH